MTGRRPRPWTAGWHGVPPVDLAMGVVLGVVAVVASAQEPGAVHPLTELASLVVGGSLVLRTRAPLATAALASAGLLVQLPWTNPTDPLWVFVAVLVVAFSAGAHRSGRRALAGALLLLGTLGVVGAVVGTQQPVEAVVSPLVIVGGPALAGRLLRHARDQAEALHRLGAELTAERAAHAEAAAHAERTRIARELHDVIAHSVSVMVVQATAAEQLLPDDDAARVHVHAVRTAGRDALAELRRSLGLLRDGGGVPA